MTTQPPYEVLLVAACRRPGTMGTWWYAAIGMDDREGHCSVGQALMPVSANPGVKEYDHKFVWMLIGHPDRAIELVNKATGLPLTWDQANSPLRSNRPKGGMWWTLGGPIYRYDNEKPPGYVGFAIRPYRYPGAGNIISDDQNVNALGGKDDLIGSKIGIWSWDHEKPNETWTIFKFGTNNVAIGLQADNGWPDFGTQ